MLLCCYAWLLLSADAGALAAAAAAPAAAAAAAAAASNAFHCYHDAELLRALS